MLSEKIKKEYIVQYITIGVALAFCLFSLIFFSIRGEINKAFMALVSIAYVFVPTLAQKLFKFRVQDTLFVFVIFYTVCPLLGYSYKLYYYLHWWDDILHAFAGFIFAMLGAYLPKMMSKDGSAPLSLCVFSAFFFSVAIAGLWEIVEFIIDNNFGTDMQKDTLLNLLRPSHLISELFGAPAGELAEIDGFLLTINGTPMEGYVDLGLLDTMTDIIVETTGAGVYTILFRIGGGKNFTFERLPDEESGKTAPIKVLEGEAEKEVAPSLADEEIAQEDVIPISIDELTNQD